jgi:hypothetical protein
VRVLRFEVFGQKIVAVAHGLDEYEREIEHQRHDASEDELRKALQTVQAASRPSLIAPSTPLASEPEHAMRPSEVWATLTPMPKRASRRRDGANVPINLSLST